MASLPKVAVIGTGGTISTRSALGSLDLVDYMASGETLGIEQLLQAVPEAARFAQLVPVPFGAVSSTHIAFAQWKDISALMDRVAAEHADLAGIVVLHGTATLEETAYMLHLAAKVEVPVVLAGAQRPLSALSSDAGANLVNAVRVASSPQARGMGVLVCLNDEIHAAREVTKSSTARLHTFRTPDFGILGQVDGDGVSFYRRPVRPGLAATEFDLRTLADLPRVDIAYSYAGEDGAVVRALTAAGARGIVVAAFPAGRLSPPQAEACAEAMEAGVAVVLSTRAGSGRAIVASDLRALGVVAADNLNPQKARILLALALARTRDARELERIFATY
jgi:L-asparaginase